jgi:hypothetical protein
LLLALLFEFAYSDVDAPCYLPNGLPASGFFACDPTAYITSCCPTGWTCYSNSMCAVTDPSISNSSFPLGTVIRGSCTNPEWNNAVCGDFCLVRQSGRELQTSTDSIKTDRDLSGDLKACGDNKFCCADDPDCSCAKGAFHLNPGRVQTIIGVEGLEHTETSTIPITTSSPSTMDSALMTPSSTEIKSPTSTVRADRKSPSEKAGVIAGIVLGVVFGALVVAVGVWFILKRFFFNGQGNNRGATRVQPTTTLPRPASTQDPYVRGNAANVGFESPVPATPFQTVTNFDYEDAPFDNEYERNMPSRNTFRNYNTTVGAGIPNDSYTGMRGLGGRPLSWVSGEEETRYGQPRTSGMRL